MGIPSYYSYIVRNHSKIIKKIHQNLICHYLYIDSNSIIYDAARALPCDTSNTSFETTLLNAICNKLMFYINLFNNPQFVMIAFDGVAPVAKLDQQRTRRFKSQFINSVMQNIKSSDQKSWDTVAITPGTAFMNKLDKKLNTYFKKFKNVLVSGPNSPGEGEHKIFQHIRNYPPSNPDHNTIVYGMDADLIMLGLNHLSFRSNIFLYRETPDYINSLNSSLDPQQNYLFDLDELSKAIIYDMTGQPNTKLFKNKMYDYIFLGLMLGNDFMPHFPAINIRTNGIDILLDTYSHVIGIKENIFDGKTINWKLFRRLVNALADNELSFLLEEYKNRETFSKRTLPSKTPEEKERKFNSMPMFERQIERYINPNLPYWEFRYYKMLFHTDITEAKLKTICKNYLEGLEWNCLYYTSGCPDWEWCYKYDYPPLLTDLIKHVPYFQTKFIENKPENPVDPLVQLSYVLPISHLHLLPKKIYEKLKDKDWYSDSFKFKWSFCKYFWEAHVDFPHIDIQELKLIVSE